MDKTEFDMFFALHSQNVDNSEKLGFWSLTDKILETYLLENMPQKEHVTVVDFGGGTGRWLLKLDEHFKTSNFIIVDLSEDMLKQANKKITTGKYRNDIRTIHSDIASVDELVDGSADYIISTYNPLSFCNKPQSVINEAYRVLKKNGTAMITVQGYHNALYSKLNNSLAGHDELRSIFREKKVRWNEEVPRLWQLTQADMENMFVQSGFDKVQSRGIACIIQPQPEDFDPENKSLGSLSKKLNEDDKLYDTVLEIELKIGREQDVINRAMNILTIGIK